MSRNITNNQILIRECINNGFEQNKQSFSDASVFFEYFAASQCLKNYGLNDDEIMYGMSGGTHDGGCDSIHVFLNSDLLLSDQIEELSAPNNSQLELVLIQAKNETGFTEDSIMKFKTVSKNLLNLSNSLDDYSGRYCEKTLENFSIFREALRKLIARQVKVFISYYYVTVANTVSENTKMQIEELRKEVLEILPSAIVEFNLIGANELIRLFNSDSDTILNLELACNSISSGTNESYVALVNLFTYYKFINKDGHINKRFFESNVRDYQGNNSVNNSILRTLETDITDDFWWLNNGVTILSEEVKLITYQELSLKNPVVVNGLQTSTEIFNYFSKDEKLGENEKRTLLIRIIVPPSDECRNSVIFATNNQTAIQKYSLRVTDDIHLQIEMYFKHRGLYYDRRKNYYKNQKKKTSEIVSVSFLAQCLISIILKKPDYARARPSTLLTDDEVYSRLYRTGNDLEAYYRTARIGKIVQFNLAKTDEISFAERSDLLFYLLYAVVSTVLKKETISFSDMASFPLESISDGVINSIKYPIYLKYKELGGNGRVAKDASFFDEIETILKNHNQEGLFDI